MKHGTNYTFSTSHTIFSCFLMPFTTAEANKISPGIFSISSGKQDDCVSNLVKLNSAKKETMWQEKYLRNKGKKKIVCKEGGRVFQDTRYFYYV